MHYLLLALVASFIWNVAPVVCISSTTGTGGLVSGLRDIAGVIDFSDIIHSLQIKFYFTVN